ncbi:tripartite motif-containing protein 3-like [Ptychodera flava]|uniref:tripartite motif-containing protein 3-like n=1 Tax=Ptychodera flava TaxID=63121 RepID=UPI003969E756
MDTDILRCSVCLEFFKEPRLLPCGHSFCFTCLSNIATEDGRSLKCALCRSILQLPVLGIQALPINYYLTSCVCIVNSSKASYAAKEEAGEDGSPMPCDEILDRLLQLKSAFCGVHGTDQVKVFCHTCKTAICLSCVKSGDHARHSLVCLPYIVEKSKDRFRELRAMCLGVQTDADQKAAFLATSRMDMNAGIAGEDDSEIDEHMRGLLQDYNLNCASYKEELMKGQSRIAEAIAVCDRLLRETDEISCLAMEETSYEEVALVALDFKTGNSSTSINPAEASASQVHHAPAANERSGNFSAANTREEVFVDTFDARWQVDRVGDPSYGDGMVLPTELRRPGGWQMPWAVAAVEEGKFFATDARSLSEFKCDGEFAGDVPLPGYEQPCFPTGICKAPGNKLLITDSANGCLLLYDHGNRRILGNFGLGHLTDTLRNLMM